ncbi:MAG TPA: hypothetical protein VHO71_03875 [Caproiciproducens sp.]|nr:hypothetical protein [Caproiciproducens sp.]
MLENGRILTGCDTCDHYNENGTGAVCTAGMDQAGTMQDGCPKYRMTYPYFCQNHAQYDRYTGMVKQLKWEI